MGWIDGFESVWFDWLIGCILQTRWFALGPSLRRSPKYDWLMACNSNQIVLIYWWLYPSRPDGVHWGQGWGVLNGIDWWISNQFGLIDWLAVSPRQDGVHWGQVWGGVSPSSPEVCSHCPEAGLQHQVQGLQDSEHGEGYDNLYFFFIRGSGCYEM